jgi:hypothetical protein
VEDDDSWLNVDPEQLDQLLGSSVDAMDVDERDLGLSDDDKMAQDQASKLHNLAQKVESFVEGEGDIEGARFEEYVMLLYTHAMAAQ